MSRLLLFLLLYNVLVDLLRVVAVAVGVVVVIVLFQKFVVVVTLAVQSIQKISSTVVLFEDI